MATRAKTAMKSKAFAQIESLKHPIAALSCLKCFKRKRKRLSGSNGHISTQVLHNQQAAKSIPKSVKGSTGKKVPQQCKTHQKTKMTQRIRASACQNTACSPAVGTHVVSGTSCDVVPHVFPESAGMWASRMWASHLPQKEKEW